MHFCLQFGLTNAILRPSIIVHFNSNIVHFNSNRFSLGPSLQWRPMIFKLWLMDVQETWSASPGVVSFLESAVDPCCRLRYAPWIVSLECWRIARPPSLQSLTVLVQTAGPETIIMAPKGHRGPTT